MKIIQQPPKEIFYNLEGLTYRELRVLRTLLGQCAVSEYTRNMFDNLSEDFPALSLIDEGEIPSIEFEPNQ